jgi:hypothetical protein
MAITKLSWIVNDNRTVAYCNASVSIMQGPPKTRAEALLNMTPQLVADVWLYPTIDGGKKLTAQPGWGCPCSSEKSRNSVFYDAWPLLNEPLAPGDRRRVGFVFLSGEEAAAVLRRAGTFYLWEGRFIGEATVIADVQQK